MAQEQGACITCIYFACKQYDETGWLLSGYCGLKKTAIKMWQTCESFSLWKNGDVGQSKSALMEECCRSEGKEVKVLKVPPIIFVKDEDGKYVNVINLSNPNDKWVLPEELKNDLKNKNK